MGSATPLIVPEVTTKQISDSNATKDFMNTRCKYKTGTCLNERARKPNDSFHSLCEQHRLLHNYNQRNFDRKKRAMKKSLEDSKLTEKCGILDSSEAAPIPKRSIATEFEYNSAPMSKIPRTEYNIFTAENYHACPPNYNTYSPLESYGDLLDSCISGSNTVSWSEEDIYILKALLC